MENEHFVRLGAAGGGGGSSSAAAAFSCHRLGCGGSGSEAAVNQHHNPHKILERV